MRGSSGGGAGGTVYSAAILLLVLLGCISLSLPANCRHPLTIKEDEDGSRRKSYAGTSSPGASSALSSSDERRKKKMTMSMCAYTGVRCADGDTCYCCQLDLPEPRCWCSKAECLVICLDCFPDSPPETPPAGGHRSWHTTVANATLN